MSVVGFPVIMNDRPAGQEGWNSTAPGVDRAEHREQQRELNTALV